MKIITFVTHRKDGALASLNLAADKIIAVEHTLDGGIVHMINGVAFGCTMTDAKRVVSELKEPDNKEEILSSFDLNPGGTA